MGLNLDFLKNPGSMKDVLKNTVAFHDKANLFGQREGGVNSFAEQLRGHDYANIFGGGEQKSPYETFRSAGDAFGIMKSEDEIHAEGKTPGTVFPGQTESSSLQTSPSTPPPNTPPPSDSGPRLGADPTLPSPSRPAPRTLNFGAGGNPFAQRAQQMGLSDYQRAQANSLRGT